ncbi:putative RNA-directed DNA polymerase [Rosa chinensis]|uniref:Putative RNA-directed DNA polymerase n=1 Tax=Rosa chinensis TaxID=74649 RepID=A0A2P6Q6L5_ROSCH|nr:putative RNA-directed DNA polymerase [Rosa chinensis]
MVESSTLNAMASINFQNDWIVDSGCGHHLTGDESKFSKLQPHIGNEAMVTADNTVHKVENEGTVVINDGGNDSITLNNVFHVPGMKKNLFSVPNAVDAGSSVLFGPHDVKFLLNIKFIKADVMHTGRRVKDTFVLSTSSSYIDKVSCNENASLWHARLGHVNFDKLKVMVRKNLVKGLPSLTTFPSKEVCEGCQFGKSHRLPFGISQSRSKAPLECIHGDLFGPTRTPSFSGLRYMLILVDDFSRFTWVYCIKQKSDAFSKFQEFKEIVEGVLGLKIKRLRTDNGGEFISDEFFFFLSSVWDKKRVVLCRNPPAKWHRRKEDQTSHGDM